LCGSLVAYHVKKKVIQSLKL